MSANLVDESYSLNLSSGVPESRYVRTFQTTGYSTLISACNDPDVPPIGHQLSTEGVIVNLVRKTPRRAGIGADRKKILVECEYTNSTQSHDRDENGRPVTDPENAVPYVQIQWNEKTTKRYYGEFIGIFADDGTAVPLNEYPPYLQNKVGTVRMMTNSANLNYESQDAKIYYKQITYWTYHRTWQNSWEQYLGNVSSEAMTITQRDQDGIRLQLSIPAKEMLLQDIIKEDHWRGSKLWFRRGLVMTRDFLAHITRVPDVGTDMSVWYHAWDNLLKGPINSNDPRLAQFADPTLPTSYVWEPILDSNGAPITSAVPLNGQGRSNTSQRYNGAGHIFNHKSYYLDYRAFDVSAWPSALGVT